MGGLGEGGCIGGDSLKTRKSPLCGLLKLGILPENDEPTVTESTATHRMSTKVSTCEDRSDICLLTDNTDRCRDAMNDIF